MCSYRDVGYKTGRKSGGTSFSCAVGSKKAVLECPLSCCNLSHQVGSGVAAQRGRGALSRLSMVSALSDRTSALGRIWVMVTGSQRE